jgi:hypothetical protein
MARREDILAEEEGDALEEGAVASEEEGAAVEGGAVEREEEGEGGLDQPEDERPRDNEMPRGDDADETGSGYASEQRLQKTSGGGAGETGNREPGAGEPKVTDNMDTDSATTREATEG